MPDNAYIYDTVNNLDCAGIPIRDAQTVNGLLVKRKILPPVIAKVRTRYAAPAVFASFQENVAQILCANTKDRHKMSY